MPLIPIDDLLADPRNANECSSETLEKIQRNIQRTGLYPPLIVRPHPELAGKYVLVDGHHRKMVLAFLGYQQAECQIWDITDTEAQIALSTLNRLRGVDNPKKRAELLNALTETFGVEELALLIPESSAEIQDMLHLLNFDFEAIEQNLKAQEAAERATLPVPFTFMVAAQDAEFVQKTLSSFEEHISSNKKMERGELLVALCREIKKTLQ